MDQPTVPYELFMDAEKQFNDSLAVRYRKEQEEWDQIKAS